MAAQLPAARLAAYQSVAAHGSVAASDRHRLVLLLLDGALERLASARGCIERRDIAGKAQCLNRGLQIIGELNGSLDMAAGGELAARLAALYDYMMRRLLQVMVNDSVKSLDEVMTLLQEIRAGWSELNTEERCKR